MARTIADVMTPNPVTLEATMTIADAARVMRELDIGDVVVYDGERVCGIVTDRDITVRAVADGKDPNTVQLRDVASADLTTVSADAPVDDAVRIMGDKALRRLLVTEDACAVGIVSIGDLAMEEDPRSALAEISAAEPNT
jgi:CBS domain-containing protein